MNMHRKHAQGKYRLREVAFSAKAANEENGKFSGYGSVFGTVDAYNEVVVPGAFAESLAAIEQQGRPLPALWQHMSTEPVGGYESLKEDARGLAVEGFLLVDEIVKAREAYALLKRNLVTGLSIGYYVRDSSRDDVTGIRTLKKLDLVEISLVTFPANDDARVDAVKSMLAHGSMPSIRQFEGILREAGFSKSQATTIASRGFKYLLDQGEPEPPKESKTTSALLAALKQTSFA